MKLRDCNLNPTYVGMSPFFRTEPEETWIQARDTGSIPLSLFDLYRRAGYLSFGSAPSFLKDDDGVLFSYFCLLVRSLMQSLIDADREVSELAEAKEQEYYPDKAKEDPSWTREKSEVAAKRSNDAFRDLLVSLHTSLDVLSELIAIFGQGRINGLKLGRSQFQRIEDWLKNEKPRLGSIASPLEVYLDRLHDILRPLIHAAPPEADWLLYMRLLRNKSIHFGRALFRSYALTGNDGRYYTFIPREWPHLWERYMKPEGSKPSHSMPDLFKKALVHQDVVEYAHGALRKTSMVIDETVTLIAKSYTEFGDFAFNQIAMDELTNNAKTFQFEHFV